MPVPVRKDRALANNSSPGIAPDSSIGSQGLITNSISKGATPSGTGLRQYLRKTLKGMPPLLGFAPE